jgi:predicted DNA-binding transcriptional regulator AlpA
MPPRDRTANAALAAYARASKNAPPDLPRRWLPNSRNHQRTPKPGDRLLDKAEVLKRVPLSYATLWAWMCEGKFPRPLAVSAKSLWLESEILEFLRYAPSRRLKGDRTPRATARRQPTRSALPPKRKPAPSVPKRTPKPPAGAVP